MFPFFGAVHSDPANFAEPKKFRPGRFLNAEGKFVADPKVAAFGVGKRRCLGENLARTSLYKFFTGE